MTSSSTDGPRPGPLRRVRVALVVALLLGALAAPAVSTTAALSTDHRDVELSITIQPSPTPSPSPSPETVGTD